MFRLLIFILSLFSTTTFAQDPYHILYGIEEGLPSVEVYDVYVDQFDQVWVTTDRGVSMYNGYEFNNFSTANGLTNNTNFKLFEDRKSNVYIFGLDGSTTLLKNGKFEKAPFSDELKAFAGNSFYYGLIEGERGQLFTHLYTNGVKSPHNHPSLYRIDTIGISKTPFIPEYYIKNGKWQIPIMEINGQALILDERRRKIISSSLSTGYREGVFPLRVRQNDIQNNVEQLHQIIRWKDGKFIPILSLTCAITNIKLDKFNNTLVCTEDGLYIYTNSDFGSPPRRYFQGKELSGFHQDRNGNYWISSQKEGLFFVPTFDFITLPNNTSDKNVKRLFIEEDRLVYMLENSMLMECDTSLITSLITDIDESSYLKYLDKTLFINDNHYLHFHPRFIQIVKNGKSISKNYGNTLRFNIHTMEHKDSSIWLGTTYGLFKINDLDANDMIKVVDKANLLDIRINDIQFDSKGNKWLATIGNGLIFLNSDNETTQLSLASGLNSEQVNTVFLENDNILWVGSNKGIEIIKLQYVKNIPQVISKISYTSKDGLLSNFINKIRAWNGKIVIANKEGIQFIESGEILKSRTKPQLIIDKIYTFDRQLDHNEAGTFGFDENFLSIEYTGVCYDKPIKNFYAYKLERNDNPSKWTYTDARIAQFTNLKHGEYSFSLKARDKNNNWSDEYVYHFRIKPHFTNTWIFWLFSAITFSFIIYYIYIQRLRFLLNKSRQDQAIKEAELKLRIANLSTFKNQFNPHFIFNSLNSIQNYIFKKDVRKANSFLSKFSKLIRESLNLSDKKYVSIEREIDFIKSYLELEFLRFPEKFEFNFINDDDIILDQFLIPPLLLQPVVENVIKHAFTNMKNGKLDIKILREADNGYFKIQIEDNGHGIRIDNTDSKTKRNSYGIRLVEDRIKLLNIDFPRVSSSFSVSNKIVGKGTIAEFCIPIIKTDMI